MRLSEHAVSVITRPLPKEKIRKRPGKAGMEFSYITPDFVIETLNEAFVGNWSTRIVHQAIYDENVVVVGLELSVPSEDGSPVCKQQFGSCEVTRGLGVGEAFKGAASDALKKCATQLGLGLELYQDDEVVGGPPSIPKFSPPSRPAAPPAVASSGPSAPSAPPRPPAPPKPLAPPRPPQAPGAPVSASPSRPATMARPSVPPAPPQAMGAMRANPFSNEDTPSSPSSTQINAMTNLASRKNVNPEQLIAAAGVADDQGHPIKSFEELNRDQAILVIKAAQQ